MSDKHPSKAPSHHYGRGWTRQNHPDFGRPAHEPGVKPKAGDWYVGPLYTGKCSEHLRREMGLNYYDGDQWVRLHVVDPHFGGSKGLDNRKQA